MACVAHTVRVPHILVEKKHDVSFAFQPESGQRKRQKAGWKKVKTGEGKELFDVTNEQIPTGGSHDTEAIEKYWILKNK